MSEVFRIHKTKDFTVMSNHHLRNARRACHDDSPERIDELIHIIADAYCSTQLALRIGNEDIPLSVVKSRIMKLNMEHIRYVLFALSQNKTKVHNIKSYLLTCLYNAPATISHFYQAAVSHDLYHSPPEVSQANVPTGT